MTLVRSLHHDAPPIHETGHQLIQTGRLSRDGHDHPHAGSVAARLLGAKNDLSPFLMVSGPIGNTGFGISHGQSASPLRGAFDPFQVAADPASPGYDSRVVLDRARWFPDESAETPGAPSLCLTDRILTRQNRPAFNLGAEPESVRDRYGRNTFGQSCLLARRLVEAGVRLVTVNMFETVFNRVTRDCHGARPFSTLGDYKNELLPAFDRAFAVLLDSTLVVATGEFGRAPTLNQAGGRDH